MSTPFAVATVKQAKDLKFVRLIGLSSAFGARYAPMVERGWYQDVNGRSILTDAGKLALELREVLGPDRGLTKAGAKAILKDNGTRATRIKLQQDGLRKSSFIIGRESTLTEDGERIRAVLLKYKADV